MASNTGPASAAGHEPSAQKKTMKAIVQHRYGPPDVLALEEIGTPALGDDEVLVRVHAAGVNYADHVFMRGVPYIMRLLAGLKRPRHGVRGSDIAGTVTEVGANVTDLRPDDEVFGSCGFYIGGAFAEYALAPRDKVVREAGDGYLRAGRIRSAGCGHGAAGAA